MLLKNDRDRRAWLEAHDLQKNGWVLWKGDMDLGRKLYRADIGGASIICEDRHLTIEYPETKKIWSTRAWYLVPDSGWSRPFEDNRISITLVLKYLRDLGTLEVPG